MNYNPDWLPNMTLEQASHIYTRPYDAFPESVRSQAVAILSVEQEAMYRRAEQDKFK